LICLAILFLAASIMSQSYEQGPDNSAIHLQSIGFRLNS
jgi:hypothetical protein